MSGIITPTLATYNKIQEKGTFPIIENFTKGGKKMEEKNEEDKIKILLSEIDQEFFKIPHHLRANFALEQINRWQLKFNEAKNKINFIDASRKPNMTNQSTEIEA
jgi:hypothetical protein